MDDTMFDQMTGDVLLRRRLEAYAEARLSPDLAASARIRARVLAVAHRRAELARADAALTVVTSDPTPVRTGAQVGVARPAGGWRTARRAAPIVLAAGMVVALAAGSAMAAAPGGPLYPARLWAESLMLPSQPSARAVAELDRLTARLKELAAANAAGDADAVHAALAAYEAILDEASTSAILARDPVAAAVLEVGLAQNVTVLQALVSTVPVPAQVAITGAIEQAIARSDAAIKAMDGGRSDPGSPGGEDGSDGAPAGAPEPKPTKAPKPTATSAPAAEPTATPEAKPTKAPKPTATAAPATEPTRTPRPDKSSPGKPPPDDPPPGGG